MSRFDEPIKMKLGEILKTFATSTYAMETGVQSAMADASPIWDLLGLTEDEYYVKYPPVDISGNGITLAPQFTGAVSVDASDNGFVASSGVTIS